MDAEQMKAAIAAYEKSLPSGATEPVAAKVERDAIDEADRYPDVPVGRLSALEEEHAQRGDFGSISGSPM